MGVSSLLIIRDGSSGLHWLSLAGNGRSASVLLPRWTPQSRTFLTIGWWWKAWFLQAYSDTILEQKWGGAPFYCQVDIQALHVVFTDTMEKEVSLSPVGEWLPTSLLWHHCGGKCGKGVSLGSPLDLCWSRWVHSFVCLLVFVIFIWVQQLLSRLSLSWSFSWGEQDFVLFVWLVVSLEVGIPGPVGFSRMPASSASGLGYTCKAQTKTHRTYFHVIFFGSWGPYLVCRLLYTFRVFLWLLYMISSTLFHLVKWIGENNIYYTFPIVEVFKYFYS